MTPEQILNVLEKQDFADFYDGEDSPFVRYLRGDDEAPSREKILQEISHLFGVKNENNPQTVA